ncbi:MAG: glycoside hydrolase family 3 N-terminal domain-containing protein [Gemmatimonadales bacterium]
MKPGRLVMPAIRWQAAGGFAAADEAIDSAIAAGVGGFIIFGGEAEAVFDLTDRLQRRAGRPLLIGADLERGAGQQFRGLPELPPPRALTALGDLDAIREAGRITAVAARSVGVNWVFAPVADLDLEPDNPIVQTRSFGADPGAVGRAVAAWIAGAHAGGALACAKHYPGHGRARHDSHDRTPVVGASREELEGVDEVPFRAAIAAGVDSIMTCHVAFPALDPTGLPATRSGPILSRLRDRLAFGGLIVSDALNMGGFAGPEADAALVDAVRAGVDVLLYPPDAGRAADALERAAEGDAAFGERVAAALRYQADVVTRLAGWSAPALVPGDHEAAGALARRLIDAGAGPVRLAAPVELVLADDDQDGAWPASPNDWFERRLRERGVGFGPGGSRILVAFAEPRASKGRGGFGPRCRGVFAETAADLAVLFAHERLAAELPAGVPVLRAWHRERPLQEAAADWVADRLG